MHTMSAITGFLATHWVLDLFWIAIATVIYAIGPVLVPTLLGINWDEEAAPNHLLLEMMRVVVAILSPFLIAVGIAILLLLGSVFMLIPNGKKMASTANQI